MNTKLKLLFTLMALLFSTIIFADANTDNGKKFFTSRCNSCHNVNAQLVGPALAKVDERRSLNWIVNFVHSPKKTY